MVGANKSQTLHPTSSQGIIMSRKHTFYLSLVAAALAATASSALAAEPAAGPSRAEVKASVLAARANGELRPAGEATQPFASRAGTPVASYREVREETLLARAHGQLVPAGEGSPYVAETGTQMARADVKEATRQARINHELIPAGEGMGPVETVARAPAKRIDLFAWRR
jgi:hypothetical protein